MKNRFLRLKELIHIVGLGKSTIYARINEGTFPAPIALGPRRVGWLESEIDQWVSDRINKSRSEV